MISRSAVVPGAAAALEPLGWRKADLQDKARYEPLVGRKVVSVGPLGTWRQPGDLDLTFPSGGTLGFAAGVRLLRCEGDVEVRVHEVFAFKMEKGTRIPQNQDDRVTRHMQDNVVRNILSERPDAVTKVIPFDSSAIPLHVYYGGPTERGWVDK
jgi:hypothetical protein